MAHNSVGWRHILHQVSLSGVPFPDSTPDRQAFQRRFWGSLPAMVAPPNEPAPPRSGGHVRHLNKNAASSAYTIQLVMQPSKIVNLKDLRDLKKPEDVVEASLENLAAFERALRDVEQTLEGLAVMTDSEHALRGVGEMHDARAELVRWTELKALLARNILVCPEAGEKQLFFHAMVRALEEERRLASRGSIAVAFDKSRMEFVGLTAAEFKTGGGATKSVKPLGSVYSWMWMVGCMLNGPHEALLGRDAELPAYFEDGAMDKGTYL